MHINTGVDFLYPLLIECIPSRQLILHERDRMRGSVFCVRERRFVLESRKRVRMRRERKCVLKKKEME